MYVFSWNGPVIILWTTSFKYDQKINSGKIYELAEVVKDLNKNTDIIADQSYSERQLFEKAYDRLKSEFEAVLKLSLIHI